MTVTPEEALEKLKHGNLRFSNEESIHPHASAKRRSKTAHAMQHPFAVILSCSDSRVPVVEIFDQGVADLFVIRVAGNVIGTTVTASVEYGVGHLKIPLLVALGHENCGAVLAATKLSEKDEIDSESSIPALLKKIQPVVAEIQSRQPGLTEDELVSRAVKANVWRSIDNLLERSPEVRKRSENGRLKIVGAVYELDTGLVEWMENRPNFRNLT